MGEVSRPTRSIQRAHANILKAYERAEKGIAHIPLGHEKLDPRTAKKRAEEVSPGMDADLHRMLYEIRGTAPDVSQTGEE